MNGMKMGIDDGPKLPAKVIDDGWRRNAVKALHARGWSLREIAKLVECSHEKVRGLLDD